jgi:phenylacetate-coenzyme A ligase PaaK-like adenylate-forming protein
MAQLFAVVSGISFAWEEHGTVVSTLRKDPMKLVDTLRFSLWTLGLKRVPHWSPERVGRLQQRRLRRLLQFAVDHSTFYREKYHGLDVERCSLTEFPPTHKGELMAHFDQAVTHPQVRRRDLEHFIEDPANAPKWYLDRYAISHTSGSQGQPMLVVQERLALELAFAFQLTRGNTACKVGPLEAWRRFRQPGRAAILGSQPGFYPSASAFLHMPPAVATYLDVRRFAPIYPDLIEQLNAFRPTAISGYASVLQELARRADGLRLAPELQQVVSNSEMLTDKARAEFRAAFGVPILDTYLTGECTFLSNGCPTDAGAHVNADWVIVEIVDEQNRPVPPGQRGHRVLVTNLANYVQPYIRYEVGDRVTMATEPCGCGNRLPRIARVEGRTADVFWVRNGDGYRQLVGLLFKNAFDPMLEVREWQAIQEERNRIRIRLELMPQAQLDEARVWRSLNRQLESASLRNLVEVSLEVVPSLGTDPTTGKLRRVVSLIGAPPEVAQAPAEVLPHHLAAPS